MWRFFQNIFWSHYSCVSGKVVSRVFSPTFFGHDIRVNIKNENRHLLETIFFPTFFARTIRVFLKKLFRAFFPPILCSRYSCEYKKRFFTLFWDFFSNIFPTLYSCVSGKIVSRIFSPLFVRDIRVNIKNVLSHFLWRFFSEHF